MERCEKSADSSLEELLIADADGSCRAGVLRRLRDMRDACAVASRQLQEREMFRRNKAMGAAVDAAISAMELMQVLDPSGAERKS